MIFLYLLTLGPSSFSLTHDSIAHAAMEASGIPVRADCSVEQGQSRAPVAAPTASAARSPHQGSAQSRAEASARTTLHRLLKPRTPDDCPICRHASPGSLGAGPVPAPVRPWSEVKSRRGAPKRIETQGFACLNQQCTYFGITDADIHALVGDGKHGRAERIQTFRCQAYRTTFSPRRDTPLSRLKTPSHQVAMVLSALAEGPDPSAAARVFGSRQTTITSLSDARWATCLALA